MTVLHLISSEGYYGAEAMLVTLARHSSYLGCNNLVSMFLDSRHPHTEVGDQARRWGLTVETVPCDGRWNWKVVRRLSDLLNKHDVDVLHTHGYKADFYGYLAAWPHRVTLVATCHNWPNKQRIMRAYAVLDRWILRKFDRVAVVSDSLRSVLRQSAFPADKVAVIYNGVSADYFAGARPSLHAEKACGRLVGFVGRLVECKGGAVLLRAARTVLERYPDVAFVLAGEGPLRSELEVMAARLGIAEKVRFLGNRSDIPAVYASLDMLVLPSLDEAAPMCVLEAMASAKPVIATRVGALPKLVIPEVTGILVEAGDAAGLAENILHLLHNPGLARRLGENGRLHAARYFSAEAMAASYVELYRQARAVQRSPGESVTPSVDQI